MLDLVKLKEQLESYLPGPWCQDLKKLALENEILRGENFALVNEVERLRAAIAIHRRRVVIDPQPWDRDLWEALQ